MDKVWIIGDIIIQIHSEVDEISDLVKLCMTENQSEEEIQKGLRYSIYILPNKGRSSVALMCTCHKDGSVIYHDNISPSYCGTVLMNQVLPQIVAREQGYLLFHASGIIANDQLILFLGKSGSGKTTLVLSAVLNYGASYFSDDFTVYSMSTQKFIPFPRLLHIKSDTEKRFMLNGKGKNEFEKRDTGGYITKYKVFYPREIEGFTRICTNSVEYKKIAFVDTRYLGNINPSIPEQIGIAADGSRFEMLVRNCANIRNAQTDLIAGYRQMRECANFYTAMFQDEKNFLKKLIDGLM